MRIFFIAKSEAGMAREAAEAVAKVEGTKEVYLISGEFDIMAILELDPNDAIDIVAKKLLGVKGIKETRTIFSQKIK